MVNQEQYFAKWTLDLKTGLVSGTPEMFLMCGLLDAGPEIDVKLLEEIVHPDDRSIFLDFIDTIIAIPRRAGIYYRIMRHDGEVRFLHTHAEAILDENGQPCLICGINQDITAHSEERQTFLLKFSDALRAEPDADAVANRAIRLLSEQLRLDRCYIGVYRLADDRGDFTHQVGNDRVPPLPDGVRLSDFPKALRVAFARTLVIDDVAETDGLSYTDRRNLGALGLRALVAATLRKGGNNPLWSIVAVSARPRRWTRDEVALVEEVTERTWAAMERARAEEALRESEAKYHELFDSMLEAFCIIELIFDESQQVVDFKYLETNPAFDKHATQQMLGKRIKEIVPSYEQYWLDQYGLVALTGQPVVTEGIVTGLGNQWFRVGAFRVGGQGSKRVGVVFENITERKKAEEALCESEERYRYVASELQAADYRKDEFLGILSHEMRNPLAAIDMGLYLLDHAKGNEEKSKTAIDIMRRQANQLSRLISDLLDVTRINNNKIILQKKRVNLTKLVHQVIQDYGEYFKEKEVELKTEVDTEPLYLDADETRLIQIVGNLLHNAVKFTHKGGVVSVTLARQFKDAVIQVEDNGEGMAPGTLTTLFTPFVQANKSLHRGENSGLGLGLVLVKGLAELHDGEIIAHSDGLDKGSKFTVRLPLAGETVNPIISTAKQTTTFRRRRILLVEDIRDVAHSLKGLLESEGHEVCVAYDGAESIAIAKEFHPEILLCDIGLPTMDGYQVAQAFRAAPELKDVFLVSVTGYARPKDIERAKDAGFNMHIAKPIDLPKLRKALTPIQSNDNQL
jgi:signal transduction histidine kinase/ActR/RegA family two-component response regulator